MARPKTAPVKRRRSKRGGDVPISIAFAADLYDRIKATAAAEERSMAALIRWAVRDYLERAEARRRDLP